MTVRKFGYLPDKPDNRDRPFAAMWLASTPPPSASVKRSVVDILDQAGTNSCVAHAFAQALRILDHGPLASRLFLYHCRAIHGGQNEDLGTYLRSCAEWLTKLGRPDEKYWPFNESKVNTRPSWNAFKHAHDRRGPKGYNRIDTWGNERLDDVRRAIAAGHPVVFGTAVSGEFVDGKAETYDTPTESVGNHALVCCGYEPGRFEIVNSWGSGWSRDGFAWLSDDYVAAGVTEDLWVLDMKNA